MTFDEDGADATLLATAHVDLEASDAITHVVSFTGRLGLQRVTLGGERLVVGRSHPADIVIESSKVSRQHCAMQVVAGIPMLTDLGSTNGTFLDGQRITKPVQLTHGACVMVGGETLTYERLTERDIAASEAAERDLHSASSYVQMLLPKPMVTKDLQADWLFMPCAQLGGSGFGYRFVSPTLFSAFLIDVAGRGTQTAMHAVTIMNTLRQSSIAGMDFTQPDQMLAGLNRSFPSDQNGGLFFSACYFTYDTATRMLRYAAAGRSPAYLADPGTGSVTLLKASSGPIGLRVDETADVVTCQVQPGARLTLVSDGVCDRLRVGSVDHMHALAVAPSEPNIPEPLRLHQAVRKLTGETVFEEDFVALVFTF